MLKRMPPQHVACQGNNGTSGVAPGQQRGCASSGNPTFEAHQ